MYSSPILTMHDRISFGGGVIKDTLVLGVSPQYQQIRNLVVPVGRFLDETDDAAHIKCAVVTEHFARDRFGSDDAAVGQNFEISGIPFTIIGVFKESVDDFGESEIAGPDHPDSLFRGPLLHRNRKCEPDLLFHAHAWTRFLTPPRRSCASSSARHRPDSVYQAQTLKEVLAMAAKIADVSDTACWWPWPRSRWRWAAWAS